MNNPAPKTIEVLSIISLCVTMSFIAVVLFCVTGLTRHFTAIAHASLLVVSATVHASFLLLLMKHFRK